MAFGGLLDGFLQEKSHAHVAGGGGRKASAFSQPAVRKDTFSMYQNREVLNGRKTSSMSMMNHHKMSTISSVSVDIYPKYSWNGSVAR